MIDKIKRYALFAGIFIAFGALSFFAGYFIRIWTAKPIVVETPGEIIEHAHNDYKPISSASTIDSSDCVSRYNGLLDEYNTFLNSLPEVTDVTPEKIFFKIYRQKYALTYNAQNTPKWGIAPIAAFQLSFREGFSGNWGFGCMVNYDIISGGIIIFSSPSVAIFGAVKVFQW